MVVVSLRRLIISLLIMIIITLMLIICGLRIIGGTQWYLKLDLQNFLFWGITAIILQVWIGGSILMKHRNLLKTIKRLSAFEDLNNINAEKSFRELGTLGEALKKVLKRENELSVMRSNRISALNNLTGLLCEGFSEAIIVTDVKGVITGVSGKLKTKINKESDETVFSNIAELRPDIKISEILGHMEKQRAQWKAPDNSGLICTPVFDKLNNIQFCIWEFETSFFAGRIKELNQQKSKIQPSSRKLKDFIKPFSRAGKS